MTGELPRRQPVPPIRRWHGPGIAAAVLAAGHLLWFTVELLGGYYWQDDFAFLNLAAVTPLGDLVLHGYNGHLQPGAFLLSWLIATWAPLSWPAAALPIVAMHAVALWLLWRFLVRLHGVRWVLLVPFAVVAFSPLTFVLSMWWAYALQLVPIELALFGALYAHVVYLQRPGLWRAVPTLSFTVIGLAFAEKAALIPFVLLGLTLALTDGRLRARIGHTWRRHGGLWSAFGVLLAGYVVVHLWRAPVADGATPTAGDLLSLVRTMIGEGLLPALYGGPWNGDWIGFAGIAPPSAVVLAVTWSLTAALVGLGLWLGRTRAALAWVTAGGYLGASVLLVAVARLGPFGALIGTDPRYIADSLPVVVVCAVVALLRPVPMPMPVPASEPLSDDPGGASPEAEPASNDVTLDADAPGAPPQAKPAPAAVVGIAVLTVVVTAAVVVGAAVSTSQAIPEMRHEAARNYVENVRAVARIEPDLVLYDAPVPADLMIPLFGDEAMASRALRGLGLRFDQPTAELRMLDGTGTPRRIGLVTTVGNAPVPNESCGFPVGPQATRIPLDERVEGQRVVVQFGYYTQLAADGIVSTPTSEFPVRFEAGLHQLAFVADGPFTELLVQAEGPVCVTNALVGLPLPQAN